MSKDKYSQYMDSVVERVRYLATNPQASFRELVAQIFSLPTDYYKGLTEVEWSVAKLPYRALVRFQQDNLKEIAAHYLIPAKGLFALPYTDWSELALAYRVAKKLPRIKPHRLPISKFVRKLRCNPFQRKKV